MKVPGQTVGPPLSEEICSVASPVRVKETDSFQHLIKLLSISLKANYVDTKQMGKMLIQNENWRRMKNTKAD